jgi:hypothetical protein
MKNILILALFACISTSVFAQANTIQNCFSSNISLSTHGASATPGLTPTDGNLPCMVIGQQVRDTLIFVNYTTVPIGNTTVPLTSLTIDSIYLPWGLCWSTNSSTNTFSAGDSGLIFITGTPTDSAGQYKLRIIITVDVSGITETVNAESATGIAYIGFA